MHLLVVSLFYTNNIKVVHINYTTILLNKKVVYANFAQLIWQHNMLYIPSFYSIFLSLLSIIYSFFPFFYQPNLFFRTNLIFFFQPTFFSAFYHSSFFYFTLCKLATLLPLYKIVAIRFFIISNITPYCFSSV